MAAHRMSLRKQRWLVYLTNVRILCMYNVDVYEYILYVASAPHLGVLVIWLPCALRNEQEIMVVNAKALPTLVTHNYVLHT